jgi:hypothetical protein
MADRDGTGDARTIGRTQHGLDGGRHGAVRHHRHDLVIVGRQTRTAGRTEPTSTRAWSHKARLALALQ